jgi:hypothetical protein
MRHIASKILYQARYDGFIRFIDGNRMNYYRNNIEHIPFKEAFNSIGTKNITDWDANLNSGERLNVLLKRDEFYDSMARLLADNGEFDVIKCLNIGSMLNLNQDEKNYICDDRCRNICSKKHLNYDIKTCNVDIFSL